ncbi:chemotaxis protein CheW [Methylicorpusculum sp.]|uniref:chemotaxis protein CheW n=1 Tax=Methylicorpusculum sp. TaxID=2713644 RepID=UPI00272656B6|nr:chemotaxis protein CheW [Methylicorpusculum sp.]MDO8843548.1 chemotaxis protein CheW [Methylicorpusculum sp.]
MTDQKSNGEIIHQDLALDLYLRTLLDDEPFDSSDSVEVDNTDADADTKAPPGPEKTISMSELDSQADNALIKEIQNPITLIKEKPNTLTKSPGLKARVDLEDALQASLSDVSRLLEATELDIKPVNQLVIVPQAKKKVTVKLPESKVVRPLAVMPDWTRYEFQALFFKVDQLVLATPLTELSRTLKFDGETRSVPGQPSWFMGLLQEHEKNVGVLDTGQLIFGKVIGQQRNLLEQPFKSLLITKDGNWALACDELLNIGKLLPEQVRWRTYRKKRPWLIGTVIDGLAAVVDVNLLTPRRLSS